MRRLLLLLVLLLPVVGWGANFTAGFAAYKRGDFETALREWMPLAEQGDALAQHSIGRMYRKGQGVARNYVEAAKWYAKAAVQGVALAQFNLGNLYHKGQGVAQDYATAAKWYRKAAKRGIPQAQNNLGLMYHRGQGVQQDDAAAKKWFQKAATLGFAEAQHNLAVMYANAQGVPQDYVKAAKWYRKAAVQGYATAQFNLGIMYTNGLGVPQDYAEAISWYRMAAIQGVAVAQYSLGLLYGSGQGVPRDYVKAAKWYHKAALQGDARAQFNLGIMYANGQGMQRDDVRAYAWFNLAAVQGNDAVAKEAGVKGRVIEGRKLTPSRIIEAQRLSRKLAAQIAAPEAQRALVSGGAATSPAPGGVGPTRGLVRQVQIGLKKLGYDPGPADGLPGRRTVAAVKAFQRESDLPSTGRVSSELLRFVEDKTAQLPTTQNADNPPIGRSASNSGFRRIHLAHRISIEIPRHWRVLSRADRKNFALAADSNLETMRFGTSLGNKERLLAVDATPPPMGAIIRVSVTTPSFLTRAAIAAMTPNDLSTFRREYRPFFAKSLTIAGSKLIAMLDPRIERLEKIPTFVLSYTRGGMNGPSPWHVTQYYIPVGKRIIQLTLSYREADGAVWKPILGRVKRSLRF